MPSMIDYYLSRPGGWHGAGRPAPVSQVRRYAGGGGYRTTLAPTPKPTGPDPATIAALEKAMEFYGPEGGFGKGVEAGIERGRTKAVAGGMQGLVSAGLAGTTMMGGLGKKYEEEIAMPARERVEETRAERLSGLHTLKAQIIQGATEAQRTRALQEYISRLQAETSLELGGLQAGTSLQLAGMRQPSITPAPTATPTRTDAGGYGSRYGGAGTSYGSVVGGGESPTFEPAAVPAGEENVYYGAAYRSPQSLAGAAQGWLDEPQSGSYSGY